MKEYDIALADNPLELLEKVSSMIAQGWEAQGGVAISHWSEHHNGVWYTLKEYAQAMVREK